MRRPDPSLIGRVLWWAVQDDGEMVTYSGIAWTNPHASVEELVKGLHDDQKRKIRKFVLRRLGFKGFYDVRTVAWDGTRIFEDTTPPVNV